MVYQFWASADWASADSKAIESILNPGDTEIGVRSHLSNKNAKTKMRYYGVSRSRLTFSSLCDVFHNKYCINICTPLFLPPYLWRNTNLLECILPKDNNKKSVKKNPRRVWYQEFCLKTFLVSGIFVSGEYKKFSDITDAELVAESLFPNAKLSALELKILLRRVYALYYNKWLTDDDAIFCVAFVKVGDM